MSKYEYIDSQTNDPVETNPVVNMFLWSVVLTSGFYNWLSRPQSATAARRQVVRNESLVPCPPTPFRVTTGAEAEAAAAMPDLVTRDFTATAPGEKFVGDITYIHTWEGFVYLATVIYCCSKKVVGYSIADHMRTELVATALANAAATMQIAAGAVFHCDRGSVYTSDEYRTLVTDLGMCASMGRTGACWDNSVLERFFASLTNERVYRTV